QEHSGLIPGVDGQDLIGRTGGYAVGNWMVFSLMPTPLGSAWKTESMVTPVFATPILTTSWLA
ncbi:hypothetical protein QS583_26635, partial [Escherichia coli]|nr:hypothetical protein [Escherichia coli]